MNTQEFSDEFDILYNNIMSNQAPGLNEYEKSVLLTKAQDEVLKNYFNLKGNKYQEGYDDSTKRQVQFARLTTVYRPVIYDVIQDYQKMDQRSKLFYAPPHDPQNPEDVLPTDVMFVLNENAYIEMDGRRRWISGVGIDYEEYARLTSKPYTCPAKNQFWRIFNTWDNGSVKTFIAEVIKPNCEILEYQFRYVRRPKPIILVDLEDEYSNVSIDGETKRTECELDETIHREILQRAVELAKIHYISADTNTIVQSGQRME